jgi:hypothetical protein
MMAWSPYLFVALFIIVVVDDVVCVFFDFPIYWFEIYFTTRSTTLLAATFEFTVLDGITDANTKMKMSMI